MNLWGQPSPFTKRLRRAEKDAKDAKGDELEGFNRPIKCPICGKMGKKDRWRRVIHKKPLEETRYCKLDGCKVK